VQTGGAHLRSSCPYLLGGRGNRWLTRDERDLPGIRVDPVAVYPGPLRCRVRAPVWSGTAAYDSGSTSRNQRGIFSVGVDHGLGKRRSTQNDEACGAKQLDRTYYRLFDDDLIYAAG
jgi:hypothetical protein